MHRRNWDHWRTCQVKKQSLLRTSESSANQGRSVYQNVYWNTSSQTWEVRAKGKYIGANTSEAKAAAIARQADPWYVVFAVSLFVLVCVFGACLVCVAVHCINNKIILDAIAEPTPQAAGSTLRGTFAKQRKTFRRLWAVYRERRGEPGLPGDLAHLFSLVQRHVAKAKVAKAKAVQPKLLTLA